MSRVLWIGSILCLMNFICIDGFSCDQFGKTGIVEENDLYISVNHKSRNLMSKQKFDKIIYNIEEIYSAIFANFGKELQIHKKWEDGTVNAYAQQKGNIAIVVMNGGLARHPEITEDALALVVCHEAGHHIGGLPLKKMGGEFEAVSWASNEGQADYFGTMKCLRKYFIAKQNNIEFVKTLTVPQSVKDDCKEQFEHLEDQSICQRSVMAGYSLAKMFRSLRMGQSDIPELMFDKKDSKVVGSTFDGHPRPQCRLDTYYSAALCNKDVAENVSYVDINQGVCARQMGEDIGVRPLCWYRPL